MGSCKEREPRLPPHEHPQEARVGHPEFDEMNPTVSGDVQTAPTSSERTKYMNPYSPVKSEAT